jgi:hypothetical protein
LSSTGSAFSAAGGFAAADGASSAPRRPHAESDVSKLTVIMNVTSVRVIGYPVYQSRNYYLIEKRIESHLI